ncbi:hypothetical protein BpHYR1_039291, partial [Brachionus plicatilis]
MNLNLRINNLEIYRVTKLADQDQTITIPSVLLDSTNMSNQDTPHQKSTEPKTPTAKTLLPLILNCYNYN